MSTQVSTTDLSRVVAAITATQAMVNQVNNRTNQIQNQVETVDNNLRVVYNELSDLQKEFTRFVKEQRNANNFQRALTEIVRVRQELEQKYGKHAEARNRLHGILDTVDTGLLREFTIASCSEQIMLDTPKYWLSPCLVALAAWISNDESLTYKAIKVALDRDVEKATLLFALVSRRTVPAEAEGDMKAVQKARQEVCFKWLDSYFKCQNPLKMKESVIVLIDSWANDIFGEDSGNICEQTFDKWMSDIRAKVPNFKEEQVSHWYKYYTYYNVSTQNQHPVLAQVSPDFPAIDAYLQRLNAAPRIQNYFDKILAQQIDKEDLINRLDEQLEALISEFDPEEEGLRKEEAHYELVKKFQGDADRVAIEEAKRKKKDLSAKVSLAQRLEDVIRSKDSKYAAARKTALNEKFLGKYVKEAYANYITDQKENFPSEITIRHESWKGWSGKTADGSNSAALTQSLKTHLENCRDKEIAALNYKKRNNAFMIAGICGVIGIIFLFIAAFVGVIGLAAAAFFAWKGYSEHKAVGLAKTKINELYAQLIDVGQKSVIAALAQWQAVLKKVADFQSDPKNEVLDLTEKQTVEDIDGFEAPEFEAEATEEAAEEAEEEVAEEDMSLEDLEGLGADDEATDLVATDDAEEEEAQTTLNQSAEFLKQFASQFSTSFVLAVPNGYQFAEVKAEQDRKALKASQE